VQHTKTKENFEMAKLDYSYLHSQTEKK